MSQYLVLSHIDIQNANSIAGLTWGFPAITHFLGFTHALNRKISSAYQGDYDTTLAGCAVIAHNFQNKVYKPKKYADFEFLQSKNPPVLAIHKNSSPPIIEEGKMNLTLSLVIELDQSLVLNTELIKQLEEQVLTLCYQMRLAGGTILNIKQVKLLSASTQEQHVNMLRKIKRLTLPGFALLDRNSYLKAHYQKLVAQHNNEENPQEKPQLLDAWLDFAALKSKAIPQTKDLCNTLDENTPATWEYISKPFSGYLVPLMTGYKAISEVYAAAVVLNTRDQITPSCFVEAIHSIGEWKGMHSINDVRSIIWRYQQEGPWYLCKQDVDAEIGDAKTTEPNEPNETNETQTLNFNDALNFF
ncbi:type I-F CRISPR-associated protein Csy2 [Gammaproteobacteria bacterium]|nr:type I-F CRISPR-associated protein Csy2 [Gammaproteobacteria bacterium]